MAAPADEPETSGVRSAAGGRRRRALRIVIAVVVVVALCLVLASLAAPDPSTASGDVRARALEACTQAGSEADACGCALDALGAAGDDLAGLDAAVGSPPTLAPVLAARVASCATEDTSG